MDDFTIELLSWENSTHPGVGSEAQDVINSQIPNDYEIFLGIIGSRFGTPTRKWGSGTEEEFRNALQRQKDGQTVKLLLYFADGEKRLSAIDPEQLAKVQSFRTELKDLGVYYFSFSDLNEAKTLLLRHLSRVIQEVLSSGYSSGLSVVEQQAESPAIDPLQNWQELVGTDPIVAIDLLAEESSSDMNVFTDRLNQITRGVQQLTRALTQESRKLPKTKELKESDAQRAIKSVSKITASFKTYASTLLRTIPQLHEAFGESITKTQRAINIAKPLIRDGDNSLLGLREQMKAFRDTIHSSLAQLESYTSTFDNWQFPQLEKLDVQRRKIIALHEDLASLIGRMVKTMDELLDEF